MKGRQVGRVNQQSKGETPLMSGVLQRAVADKEMEGTQEVESGGLSQSRFVHDFSQVPIGRGGLPIIQAKLMIGAAEDRYEQEAERVAKDVVSRMNAPASSTVQREEISELEEEELQKKPIVQRVSDVGGMAASPDLEASIQGARGSGQLLPDSVRETIEREFGADFSGVRVHTDAKSDELNRSVQAKAFTTGNDIFFQQGAYEPKSWDGQELLVHELTHVVQQNGGIVQQMQPQVTKQAFQEPASLKEKVKIMEKSKKDNQSIGESAVHSNELVRYGEGQGQHYRLAKSSLAGLDAHVVQRTVVSDLNDAQGNFNYIVAEVGNVNTAAGNVTNAISLAPPGVDQTNAAAGLLDYTHKFVDQVEGKKAEIYEAERLVTKPANKRRLPILSGNDKVDPDIRYKNSAGQMVAKEVKAISSAEVGMVTQRIKEADKQLGSHAGNLKNHKILIRIENQNNEWPGIQAQRRMFNDNDLKKEINAAVPMLNWADEIRIENINAEYAGGLKNVVGEVTGSGAVPKSKMIIF